jgi:hypothetical protein
MESTLPKWFEIVMSEQDKMDDQLVKDFDKGRDWFRKNNIDAYMALLD